MADENPVDIADEAIETSGDDFLEENIEVEHKAETEVGITEFLTPGLAPISGIIKHRYNCTFRRVLISSKVFRL